MQLREVELSVSLLSREADEANAKEPRVAAAMKTFDPLVPRSPTLGGTLIVACRSPSSQPRYDFNEFLLLFECMLELVLLRLVPIAHFGKQLHRAELIGEFDLAALCVVGLRQSVIGGYFSDGSF